MKKIIYIILLAVATMATSCYEDFELDNPFTAVYFPFQQPIRTVLNTDPTFEIGVVLGGKRENTTTERVTISYDPSLLDNVDDDRKVALPRDYFTMDFEEDSTLIIAPGNFNGVASVTLNEQFLNDANSLGIDYILPLKITRFSTDSVLVDKFFTLAAVRYVNDFHGLYYQLGSDKAGADEAFIYEQPDLVRNKRYEISSSGPNKVIYANIANNSGVEIELTISGTSVTAEHIDGATAFNLTSGIYDEASKTINLEYTYTLDDAIEHVVTERLIFTSNAKAFELTEWQ